MSAAESSKRERNEQIDDIESFSDEEEIKDNSSTKKQKINHDDPFLEYRWLLYFAIVPEEAADVDTAIVKVWVHNHLQFELIQRLVIEYQKAHDIPSAAVYEIICDLAKHGWLKIMKSFIESSDDVLAEEFDDYIINRSIVDKVNGEDKLIEQIINDAQNQPPPIKFDYSFVQPTPHQIREQKADHASFAFILYDFS